MTRRLIIFLPLAVFVAFVIAAIWRLSSPPDKVVRSRLAGQPVPTFALPAALPGRASLSSANLTDGKPHLVNVFASWCVPCINEAPILADLKERGVSIHAIAIRDRPEDIAEFLQRHGDPFDRIGSDVDSKVQLSLGSSGVPETFVVDGRGIIRYQHVGEIERGDVPMVLAALEKAR